MPRLADGTPERLGRYRLVRPISTGGMARVFEARRESLAGVAPTVAIKVILPDYAGDANFQRLFENEARVGALLRHPNLVAVQDFDHQDGVAFLVMDYVEGITLRRVVNTCRRHGVLIPLPIVAEIGRQACEGLHHAHTLRGDDGALLRLVHRDVKPSNLVLSPQGVVKVLDFGISRAMFGADDRDAVRGTWGYMGLEQGEGTELGPPADVFGMAAVLFELAMADPLFPEKDAALIRGLLKEDEAAKRAAQLSGPFAPLAPILVRALQRDPAARYSTAAALARALAPLTRDPVTAQDQLVRFTEQMLQLSEPRPNAAEPAVQPSQGTLQTGPPGMLPVAVGTHERPLPPLARQTPSDRWLHRIVPTAFLLLGVAIVLFTAVQLYVTRRDRGAREAPPARVSSVPASQGAASGASASGAPPATSAAGAPGPQDVVPVTPVGAAPSGSPSASARAPAVVAAAGRGVLTLSSTPKAQVYVDGVFVRHTPLFRYELDAGTHAVTLIADDGRRTSTALVVEEGRELQQSWSFDRGAWDVSAP